MFAEYIFRDAIKRQKRPIKDAFYLMNEIDYGRKLEFW